MNIFEEKLNIYPPVLFQLLLALMREGGREGERERWLLYVFFFFIYILAFPLYIILICPKVSNLFPSFYLVSQHPIFLFLKFFFALNIKF